MKRYCYALDLIDDEKLIEEYIHYHNNVWPEIQESILNTGIKLMEIYHISNRLFMITEVDETFSLNKKNNNKNKIKVEEWENLMWKYQKALPTAKKGEKWLLMNKIYHLENNDSTKENIFQKKVKKIKNE